MLSPAQPAIQQDSPAEGTIFVQVRPNPARTGKNYHTHEHPRGGGQGKKIGLRGRSRTRKGVLEIGPHFGPPPGPLGALL